MRGYNERDSESDGRKGKARVVGIVVVVVLLVAAVGGFVIWARAAVGASESMLGSVIRQAGGVAERVGQGDLTAAADQVAQADADATTLVEALDSPGWRILSSIPVVGERAANMQTVAEALKGVLGAASAVAPAKSRILDGSFRGADGAIDVEWLKQTGPSLSRLAFSMRSAEQSLAAMNPASLTKDQQEDVARITDELEKQTGVVESASKAVLRITTMLGSEEPRHWLVLVQNPAQPSGSGGRMAGYLLVTVDRGQLAIEKSGVLADIAGMDIPAVLVGKERRALWEDRVRFWPHYDGSADFPSIAPIAALGMAALGNPVDGIVTIGPEALSRMLASTGPVTSGGVTVTSDNVAGVITEQLPSQIADARVRDERIVDLTSKTLEEFWSQPLDVGDTVDALGPAVAGGGLKVWSGFEAEQSWLSDLAISGSLRKGPGSSVAVVVNDAGAEMSDSRLSVDIAYAQGSCSVDRSRLSGVNVGILDVSSSSGIADSEQPTIENVYVYGPQGATLKSARLGDQELTLFMGEEAGRPVWWTPLFISKGVKQNLLVTFLEPDVPGSTPDVRTQAFAVMPKVSVTPGAACTK